MSLLAEIDVNKDIPEYKLELHKLNEEPVMTIQNIIDLNYKPEFAGIDELTFKVPLYRHGIDGEKIENERYHAIKGDMLILFNGMKYFYIHYSKESVSSDGKIYKEVQAYSREFELSQKKLMGYEGVSRKLYTMPVHGEEAEEDENGVKRGFLNHVESVSSWRVKYISNDLYNKYRALSFSDTNLLASFKEVQKTFGCIFQFDTLKKTISAYEIDELESDRGLYISDKNFLKDLSKTIKSDEIKTRLYLYGHENISIQELSIVGKPYIENFDFYKNRDYMSQELIDALDKHDELIGEEEGLFKQYLMDLERLNPLLREKQDEWIEETNKLGTEEILLDTILARPYETTEERNKALSEQRDVIRKQQEKCDKIEDEMNDYIKRAERVYEKISELRKRINEKSTFTEELERELDSFIREDVYRNDDYRADSLEELLEEGYKILNEISQPAIQFEANIIDFLSIVECQHDWDKLILGDKVRLYHEELNFDYHVRMVGYDHQPDSGSLKLKFSSTGTIDDDSLYLRDLIEDMNTTSSNVDFNKYKWDKGEEANLAINSFVNNNFDLAKQSLDTADGQVTVLDHRGYWGTKLEEDGSESPEKLRMTNNLIAMTQDNWETIDVAISPTLGINATLINGKLGNFAEINANQIFVDNETDDSPLAQYIRANAGGKVYNQEEPPDTVDGVVDPEIGIADGALWLRGEDGAVDQVFRYSKDETFDWESIGDYEGECHWEEVTDLALKDKDYDGMKITDHGLVTTKNGVSINGRGIVVANISEAGTTLSTMMSAKGFGIYKKGVGQKEESPVFEVNEEGQLRLSSNENVYLQLTGESIELVGGKFGKIIITETGIELPAASSLQVGDKETNRYVNITSSEVVFGQHGFKYDLVANRLTIGGENGLRYEHGKLYIGNEELAGITEIINLKEEITSLARMIRDKEALPAYVVFA